MSPNSPTTRYWNRVAGNFAKQQHYLDSFLSAMKRQAYLDLLEQWDGLPTTGRVLKTDLFEEATGPGMFLDALADRGADVYGIDLSAEMVNQASKRLNRNDVTLVAGDARALPFPAHCFDLIISPSTLDHFIDPTDLGVSLREIVRVLKPGGRLIITLDNRQNITDFLLRVAKTFRLIPFFLGRSYTIRELSDELEQAGLTVRDTSAILHNPRLFAVATVAVARRIPFRFVTTMVRSTLTSMQRFGKTRWRFRTGSFIAALAVLPPDDPQDSDRA